jgi:hypothetical protein
MEKSSPWMVTSTVAARESTKPRLADGISRENSRKDSVFGKKERINWVFFQGANVMMTMLFFFIRPKCVEIAMQVVV